MLMLNVFDVRHLSQNLAFQELFVSDDEQVFAACQVSSTVFRRIVSFTIQFLVNPNRSDFWDVMCSVGGAMSSASDLQSNSHTFDSHSEHGCSTTLGTLFTPIHLRHQAV